MKKIFLTILLGISLSLTAQNITLAKINFEAAEEAYNNSNYELALEKLSKAEEFFGQINLPILYLRVINQDKLLAQKPSFTLLQELKNNCTSFLSNYSDDSEAFEKIKDVYNIDEKWNKIKIEADFENYLKEFKVKQKREEIIALAKEIELDYLNALNNYPYAGSKDINVGSNGSHSIEFLLNFDSNTFLLTKKQNQDITFKVHLNDVKLLETDLNKMIVHHNKKTEVYGLKERINTIHGTKIADKLLILINLLTATNQ